MTKEERLILISKDSRRHTTEDIITIMTSYGLEHVENYADYTQYFRMVYPDVTVYVETTKKEMKSAHFSGKIVENDKPWRIRHLIYTGGYGLPHADQMYVFDSFDDFFLKQWRYSKLPTIKSSLWETEVQAKLKQLIGNESKDLNKE